MNTTKGGQLCICGHRKAEHKLDGRECYSCRKCGQYRPRFSIKSLKAVIR